MEDDGVTDQPVWIRLKLVVKDDEVIADWTDSDPQARGPVNATFVVTAVASYSGLLHVTNKDIPRNSGCYRPIRVVTKPGTVVNVRHPGPSVGGDTETHPHIQNVVIAALSQAIPERTAAAEGTSACNFHFGGFHPETGEYYTNYHIDGSGWGATAYHDGNNVLCPENGNCRNTPVEVLETKYPFLPLEYRLRPDSDGPGKYRGGLGSSRILRVLAPEITVNALMDRTKTHAWGLFGGGQGATGCILVKKRVIHNSVLFRKPLVPSLIPNLPESFSKKGTRSCSSPQVEADMAPRQNALWRLLKKIFGKGLFLWKRLDSFMGTRDKKWREDMGYWEENSAKWYEQNYCILCGRIIPKMLWIAEEEGEKKIFCGPDCEKLYQEYWLPAHRQKAS